MYLKIIRKYTFNDYVTMNSVYIILFFIPSQSSNVIFNIFFVEEEAREAKRPEPSEVMQRRGYGSHFREPLGGGRRCHLGKGRGQSHLSPWGFRREAVSAVEKHRPFF